MKSIYLYPGQSAASAEPAEIRTILGSCVAVAMHDPVAKVGGLNHYLLATPSDGNDRTLRYGTTAISALLQQMLDNGADRSRIKAKIYGGASVLDLGDSGQMVGERNIEIAHTELKRLGIPIVEENTGGKLGRKIRLHSNTFEVEHEFMRGENGEPDTSGASIPTLKRQVRIIIVDDSMTVRQIFLKILDKDPRISVVGVASDAFEARALLVKEKPDVMLLDIEMPKMNGVAFLEKVMKHLPTPTIMVSSLGANEDAAQRCVEIGAVEFVHKPSQYDPMVLRSLAENLAEKIIVAASVPLHQILSRRNSSQNRPKERVRYSTVDFRSQLIVVGGNAGAQQGLEEFLSSLAADSPPTVVAVSTVTSFLGAFLKDLQKKCEVRLHVANDGFPVSPGNVYFAPAQKNLRLEKLSGGGCKMVLEDPTPGCSHLPSATRLFETALEACADPGSLIAVLLSGFGHDGVDSLLKLRSAGARTLVANPRSAPFSFVPGGAVRIGAAEQVLEPAEMAEAIFRIRNKAVA